MERASILIIDDDIQVLSGYVRVLTEEDYDVSAVQNGHDALELLKDKHFNLVITDFIMKGMNGLEVLEKAKKISPETAVILVSGYGILETSIEAMRRDAADFIIKPCDREELIYRVKKALERQQLETDAREAKLHKSMSETLGAVAHEINNPLTGIIGNAELLLIDVSESDSDYKSLTNIMRSAERIAETVQQMRKIKGIKTKKYAGGSEILDLQKSAKFTHPEEKTVLVVDDEETVVFTVTKKLSSSGYDVDSVSSGSEALEKIKKKNYAVVILDVSMPGMDGYETLQKMNKYYTDRKVQIPATIMYTGYDVEDILQKCKKTGAYTALHKPTKLTELIDTVKRAEEYSGK